MADELVNRGVVYLTYKIHVALPNQCIHCLKVVPDITADHVFPRAWYPDTTPANMEKWQAPACRDCNATYGRLEEEILLKLGICLDSDAPASSGIGQKALDAMNYAKGRSEKDASIRHRKALQLLSRSVSIPGQLKPEFIEVLNSGPANLGTSISRKDLDRIAEKIVRGVIWVHLQEVVDERCVIKVSSSPKPNPEFDALTIQNGVRYDRGPGFTVYWARPPEDPICGYFLMKFFDRIDLRATVLPRSPEQG